MKGLGGHLHVLSLFFRGHLLNIPGYWSQDGILNKAWKDR